MRGAPHSGLSTLICRISAPQVRVDLRSASKGAGFPSPISPEAGPVPAHQGLRPDDRDGLEDRWKPSIQHDLPRSWASARAAYLERRSPNANGLGGQNSV